MVSRVRPLHTTVPIILYYGPTDLTITENEDGTVYYDFKLRDDLTFSDGGR